MASKAARKRHRDYKRRAERQRAIRNRGRSRSYRESLIETIRLWFPFQFFAQWTLLGGIKWTPQRIFWMAMLTAWSAERSLEERFDASSTLLKELFPKWTLGMSYTGWSEAQAKWLPEMTRAIKKRLQKQMRERLGKYWLREGWCAFAADGSRFECPRTRANEKALLCAGREKTGPQLFATTLWHMGTGLPWDFRIGPGTSSERRHLEEMALALPARSLLVADAGFTGYDFYKRLLKAGCHFLMRVGSNVHLLKDLGFAADEGRNTVYVWPEERTKQAPLTLRLIVLGRGKKKMYLLTDVRDKAVLSEKTAATLYEMRWGIEVFYRSTKQTFERRRMLSRSPEQAECELTWALLAIWLLGLMSVSSIIERGRDPLKWSAAAARKKVRRTMRLALTTRRCRESLSESLGDAVQDEYQRTGPKKARNWPHKKKEKPPGSPKITGPTEKQLRALRKLKETSVAA